MRRARELAHRSGGLRVPVAAALVLALAAAACGPGDGTGGGAAPGPIDLPEPDETGGMSLENALAARRSVREFSAVALTAAEISQLAWAAQGTTREWGGRTSPSAGGLYPLELYWVTETGTHHYLPEGHRAREHASLDLRRDLAAAALDQQWVAEAPAVFVITAVFARTAAKYGDRSERYVHLEAGHAAQNLLLQAVALDLGGVPVGAFRDDEVQRVLDLPADHEPLYLIPVGHPAE